MAVETNPKYDEILSQLGVLKIGGIIEMHDGPATIVGIQLIDERQALFSIEREDGSRETLHIGKGIFSDLRLVK